MNIELQKTDWYVWRKTEKNIDIPDTISSETASATIQINSPFKVNGASQTTAIFSNGTGGQAQFTNGSITWDVGLENSGGNFIIDTGVGANKFQLSTAGTLTVPNLSLIPH